MEASLESAEKRHCRLTLYNGTTALREDRRAALMWVKVGNDCLNLDNIVSFHFARDDDGAVAVIVETISGHVKHYQGNEAETLKQHFDALAAGPPETKPFEPL